MGSSKKGPERSAPPQRHCALRLRQRRLVLHVPRLDTRPRTDGVPKVLAPHASALSGQCACFGLRAGIRRLPRSDTRLLPPRILLASADGSRMNRSASVSSLCRQGAKLALARARRRVRLGRRVLRIAVLCAAIQLTTTVVAVQAVHGSSAGDVASPCASRQLVISLGTLSAATGHLVLPIRFQDRAGTCSLRGFPSVDGLSASGRVIIRAKPALKGFFGRWRIATITLTNGQTASALLEGLDPAFLSRPPPSSRSLRITPPNASHSVRRRTSYPLCDLIIHPVVAGSDGRGT